uniref:Glycosyltransferase family 2 protein n=1 Tax=Ignisphaera aggregans TaxID=334771 RepID=A0A7C4FHZ3_9CREN
MILTLYFTKDESTFNFCSLKSVVSQEGVTQKVYVVSASPINLRKYGFNLTNIVVPTKQSWPIPIRIGFSFNAALKLIKEDISKYSYLFKVDGDVVLPKDYLMRLIASKPLIAGYGPAMLLSTKFFKVILGGRYPINYCDDGYIIAVAIAKGIWPKLHDSKIEIPQVRTIPLREYMYGIEYYKWGMPLPFLILHILTRIYLRVTKKMKETQEKSFRAYLWNIVGYIHASINKKRRYYFHREYGRMRILHIYRSIQALRS